MSARLSFLVAALLLAEACGSGPPARGQKLGSDHGIQGQVLIGPTCPVERAGSPCPDKPVQAVVTALVRLGKAAGSVRTDANGNFSLAIAPGSYLVYAHELSDNPRLSRFQRVTVRAGAVVTLKLVIDTGIR